MAATITNTYTEDERNSAIFEVLIRVSGGASVARALREARDEGKIVPSDRVFWTWHFRDEQLQHDLARARQNGVEVHLDECKEIADNANADAYIEYRQDGTPVAKVDGEAISRSRLRFDARIKLAQMIAPRKYGPKLDMTTDGQALTGVSEAQRAAKAAALFREIKRLPAPEKPVISDRVKALFDD